MYENEEIQNNTDHDIKGDRALFTKLKWHSFFVTRGILGVIEKKFRGGALYR